MHDELRKYIKELLERATGLKVYFEIANNESIFPYIVFDIRELVGYSINRHILELTIDVWDKDTPKHLINAVDVLDKIFLQYKDNTEHFVIQIYNGSARQFIQDDDKSIKRLQRRYDVIVYLKGDLL